MQTKRTRVSARFLKPFELRLKIRSPRADKTRDAFFFSHVENDKHIDLSVLIEYMYPEIRRGSLSGSIRVRQPGKSFKAERSRWFHSHADLFTFSSRSCREFSYSLRPCLEQPSILVNSSFSTCLNIPIIISGSFSFCMHFKWNFNHFFIVLERWLKRRKDAQARTNRTNNF